MRERRRFESELALLEVDGREYEKKQPLPKLTVGTTWVNKFNHCNQTRLTHSDDVVRGFGNAMRRRGHRWVFDSNNTSARRADWIDPAFGGRDDNVTKGIDSVDFGYFSTHGATRTDVDATGKIRTYFFDVSFNFPKECDWVSTSARFGNKQLKWLVMDACESMPLKKHVNTKVLPDPDPSKVWSRSFHGLHIIFGFAQNASDAWWSDYRGLTFGERAGSGKKLVDSWVDAAYSYWLDDYPVAMAAGRTVQDAETRANDERISSNFPSIANKDIAAFRTVWRD